MYAIACHSIDGVATRIVGTYTIGAFVHVLLVVAILLFLVGLLSGRRGLAAQSREGWGDGPPAEW